jgi:hypothetical protein
VLWFTPVSFAICRVDRDGHSHSLVAVDIAFRPAAPPQRSATHRASGLEVANRSPRRSRPRRRAHLLRRLMVASSQAVDRVELSQHTLWRMSGWEAYGKPAADLAAQDAGEMPGATRWRKLASVYLRLGNAADALAALRKGRDILAALVAIAPSYAQWKKDLAWFDQQIARLEGQKEEAGRN